METILVVDDQPAERRLLYHALKAEHRVLEAGDGPGAIDQLSHGPVDLVVLDLHLPPDTSTAAAGVHLAGEIHERFPRLPIVIATGDQDRSLALEMVRGGVADFLLKPVAPDVLKVVVARALERARMQGEIDELRSKMGERRTFGGLIGESPLMKHLFARLARLAPQTTAVLLLGESGTGKSAVARALHYESRRAGKPFVVVDGATIPESLIESELFGHVRGAFTGAEADKTGRVRLAHGGTLFLDEIGNLSPAAQSKLLLFLDNHAFSPVGSNESIPVDARLIAATNQELEPMVRQGRFREDLLYRIQVATVSLPPLRERKEDVVPLAELFLASLGKEIGRPGARLTSDAAKLLEQHPWPGNVRQLKHVLESSLVQAEGEELDAADLSLAAPVAGGGARVVGEPVAPATPCGAATAPPDPGDVAGGSLKARLSHYERRLLEDALARTHGNKAAAGRLLGLDENQIHYLCRKHGLH